MRRFALLALAGLLSLLALTEAVRLVVPAGSTTAVRRQLTFLRAELTAGAARDAQQSFPEGYFFLYALYGLTAVNVGEPDEARWALAALQSPEGRAPFDGPMPIEYGVFYRGWVNLLRGGIVGLDPSSVAERRAYDADSLALAAAFDASPTPFLTSYPGRAWPVDSTVAMASLALHDRKAHAPTITRWTAAVRERLDPDTGLIAHTADANTGFPTSGAQGTSQSIVHRFLPFIDSTFARAQYVRFRDLFLARPLGIGPAVREYPHGVDGSANVDSGPLPMGISLSATVVTIGAARVQGDRSLADGLASFGEVAGLPFDTPDSRRYALGLLPIGDAFLAWALSTPGAMSSPPGGVAPAPSGALSAPDRTDRSVYPAGPPSVLAWWWRLPLLALFVLIATAPWVTILIRRRRKSRHSVPPTE